MKRPFLEMATAVVALGGLFAPLGRAQEAAGPPPPTSTRTAAGLEVHELLPDVGKIGSQVGFWGGVSWNPYEVGTGFQVGGFIDLPLVRFAGGKLSYEILLGFSQGTGDAFVATNPVAYVANLAAGASPAAALAGPPQAPFPVQREVTLNLRLLQVSPFSLKWTLSREVTRLRPYVVVGGDFLVVLTRVDPLRDESLAFTGTSPFDDALIGGLVAQAPELGARGIPSGQGNLELGGHAAAGLEVRLSPTLSLNLEYRFTQVGTKAHLQTAHAALGFHW
jgi:opacity protein-like surface antigen